MVSELLRKVHERFGLDPGTGRVADFVVDLGNPDSLAVGFRLVLEELEALEHIAESLAQGIVTHRHP